MVAITWVDTTFRTGLVCFHYSYHSYYNDSVSTIGFILVVAGKGTCTFKCVL